MVDSKENYKLDLGIKGLKMTKIDKNHNLCHNWQLNAHKLSQKVLLTLILGEKNAFKFTWNIMLSFMTSQYRWRTTQTGH